MQIKTALIPFALALAGLGCDAPVEHDRPLPVPDAAVVPADAPPLRLELIDATSGLLGAPEGPFRLLAEESRGQGRIEALIAERIDRWPHTAELDGLPPGTWRLTVYADRNGDAHFDGCPFPPEPGHAERADEMDNIVGIIDVQGGRDAVAQVPITRRICGPGDLATGIEGTLLRPDDPLLDGVAVRAVLVPDIDPVARQARDDDAPQPQALRFAVFPEGAPAGEAAFRVDELIPGRYRLQLFADDDGDGNSSPCAGDSPGGGDRYVAELAGIDVVAGERIRLERPITLEAAACPDPLTGVVGAVVLPGDIAGADGALRVEVTPVDGGEPVAATALVETLRGRMQPHPFTISGLPSGTWRVRLFLDLDGDRRFSPCTGMPSTAGFDHISATLDDVVIAPGSLLPLGDIELTDAACPLSAGIAGYADAEVEPGALASGRAVRMHLEPLDGGEPLALRLFADHVDRDGTEGRFGRRIPSGRYRARAYVDTDRDGELSPCEADPYGDRGQSVPFDIDVGPEETIDLPLIDVTALDCPVPDAALEPRLALDGLDSLGERPERVLIHVREDGGWSTTHEVLLGSLDGDEPVAPRIELAPGEYTVAAFVDGDEDGVLDPCDAPTPDPFQAVVSLTLNDSQTVGRPSLRPSACDR